MPAKYTPKKREQAFWNRVAKSDGCWLWIGAMRKDGYGSFSFDGRKRLAHHFLIGNAPEGLEWDHVCRNRGCIRPEHLEAVTHGENARRGEAGSKIAAINRDKTHCPQGHPYDEENTRYRPNGARRCAECNRIQSREGQRKIRLHAFNASQTPSQPIAPAAPAFPLPSSPDAPPPPPP